MRRRRVLVLAFLLLVACQTTTQPAPGPSPITTTPSPVACQVGDQAQYIYHPDRLSVQAACIHVTGEVLAIVSEADGDFHVRVLLDSQYQNLLTPGNQQQCANNDQGVRTCGLLVVEPICVHTVTQSDAQASCAADPDPLQNLPGVGQHVWLEGRYVLDLDHFSWAEIHPLGAWGLI